MDIKYKCPNCDNTFSTSAPLGPPSAMRYICPKCDTDVTMALIKQKDPKELDVDNHDVGIRCNKCGLVFFDINTTQACPQCGEVAFMHWKLDPPLSQYVTIAEYKRNKMKESEKIMDESIRADEESFNESVEDDPSLVTAIVYAKNVEAAVTKISEPWNPSVETSVKMDVEATEDLMEAIKNTKGKPKLQLVPMQILYDCAEVREQATSTKYPDPNSWKLAPVEEYYYAALRHIIAIQQKGLRSIAEDTGIAHYKHLSCDMAFVCQLLREEES